MTTPVPDDRAMPIPYLMTGSAADAIEFYTRALGATELYRLPMADGSIGHAELRLGTGVLYLADMASGLDAAMADPAELGRTTVSLALSVDDVDETGERAVAAGATAVDEPEDQFYGDRRGTFIDPFGHHWSVATHVRDVDPEEMETAMRAWERNR